MRIANDTVPTELGDFSWSLRNGQRYLSMRLPCGHLATLPVVKADEQRAWTWNGDENKPLLSQSIFCKSGEAPRADCWHGYLSHGVFMDL